jgi:hypothetical protein
MQLCILFIVEKASVRADPKGRAWKRDRLANAHVGSVVQWLGGSGEELRLLLRLLLEHELLLMAARQRSCC